MAQKNGKGFRFCVYGGQFGSEGKGCVAEWLIQNHHDMARQMVVMGENAPNSGHSNSMGKTRSLPVSAYFADVVLLGPDSAIDPHLLSSEIGRIRLHRPKLQVFVHAHAAIITSGEVDQEKISSTLEARIASTVTGGGAARTNKAFLRQNSCIVNQCSGMFPEFEVVDRVRWFEILFGLEREDWLFECSQGLMLDNNLGYFPYVTSRTTHPRVAIERNGLGPSSEWSFIGVYRTYPIRTGGNSGITGGSELQWTSIGVKPEIAVVTKRVRRVFDFSGADFLYSINLVKPDAIAFTHLDYLPFAYREPYSFIEWLGKKVGLGVLLGKHPSLEDLVMITSDAPSMFKYCGHIFKDEGKTYNNPFALAVEASV